MRQNGPELEGHKGTDSSLFTWKHEPFYTSLLQKELTMALRYIAYFSRTRFLHTSCGVPPPLHFHQEGEEEWWEEVAEDAASFVSPFSKKLLADTREEKEDMPMKQRTGRRRGWKRGYP